MQRDPVFCAPAAWTQAGFLAQVVSLEGLDPKADYRVSFEDTPETFTRGGKSLMEEGLRLNLAERFTSALVYLERK